MCDSMDGRIVDPTSPMRNFVHTPNLDSLASEGVNFVRAYASSPQCTPSRSSMITGRRVDQIHSWTNYEAIAATPSGELDVHCIEKLGKTTCAEMAHRQGTVVTFFDALNSTMDVALFGKVAAGANLLNRFSGIAEKWDFNHLSLDVMTRSANIQRPIKIPPYITYDLDSSEAWLTRDRITRDGCINWLRSKKGSNPWFLYCSFVIPHPPWKVNRTWLNYVDKAFVKRTVPKWPRIHDLHPFDAHMSIAKYLGPRDEKRTTIVLAFINLLVLVILVIAILSSCICNRRHVHKSTELTGVELDEVTRFRSNNREGGTATLLVPINRTNTRHNLCLCLLWTLLCIASIASFPLIVLLCTAQSAYIPAPSKQRIYGARRAYFAAIAKTDHIVGDILQTVRVRHDYNNTFVIFVSDHGEMNMEHRQCLKNSHYEGSLRVPMIIGGGIVYGARPEKVVFNTTSLLDIYPTLLDMARFKQPENGSLSGGSLAPFLGESRGTLFELPRKQCAVSQYHSTFSNTGSFAIICGRYKYITFGHNSPLYSKRAGYVAQLFDLDADPDEVQNIAATQPDTVHWLDSALRRELASGTNALSPDGDYNEIDRYVKRHQRQEYLHFRDSMNSWDLFVAFTTTYFGFSYTDWLQIQRWSHDTF